MSNQVAQIILSQLGGNKFLVMTGAKNLLAHPDALSFRIASTMTRNKCNSVKITLNSNDLYDITFSKIHARTVKEISSHSDIYCDQLEEFFSDATGLATRLF